MTGLALGLQWMKLRAEVNIELLPDLWTVFQLIQAVWTDCRWYSVGDSQISISVIHREPVWRAGNVDTDD